MIHNFLSKTTLWSKT